MFLDPFAVASPIKNDPPLPSHSKIVTSVQHEPQLFVPPASPADQNNTGETVKKISELPRTNAPPLLGDNNSSISKPNPYSRSSAAGPRPMFPSNNQLYQTSSQPPISQVHFQSSLSPALSASSKNVDQASAGNFKPTNAAIPPSNIEFYQPVVPHWFYCKTTERCNIWCPFSYDDSAVLEQHFQAGMVVIFMFFIIIEWQYKCSQN